MLQGHYHGFGSQKSMQDEKGAEKETFTKPKFCPMVFCEGQKANGEEGAPQLAECCL